MLTLRPHQKRALDALLNTSRGCVYCPTGGGKTMIMIEDLKRRLNASETPQTVVIAAPRILLATQLSEEFESALRGHVDFVIGHVHSGETHHWRSTNLDKIENFVKLKDCFNTHVILFTTYHSLSRVVDSGIEINYAYFDEAHNATQKGHFVGVAATSMSSDNAYFFTATPKFSRSPLGRGMNNSEIYGNTIINVPAPELINNGSIIPPQIVPYQTDVQRNKENAHSIDRDTVLNVLDELDDDDSAKVLVAAPNTKILWNTLTKSDLLVQLEMRGYDVLHITSKHGAYVNRQKVDREKFFETLQTWGKDKSRKFVLFHYSILSEGINVPGLTHAILLRQLPIVEMAQTIGRVIRMDRDDSRDIADGKLIAGQLHSYRKPCGYVTVPVHSKTGVATARRLQELVNTIFEKGIPAVDYV